MLKLTVELRLYYTGQDQQATKQLLAWSSVMTASLINLLTCCVFGCVQVTGDAANTATAIARQVGIVSAPAALDRVTAFVLPDGNAGVAPSSRMSAMDLRNTVFTQSTSGTFNFVGAGEGGAASASKKHVLASPAVLVLGAELELLSEQGWDFIFAHPEMVFARTTPYQKLQIVREAQKRGDR